MAKLSMALIIWVKQREEFIKIYTPDLGEYMQYVVL